MTPLIIGLIYILDGRVTGALAMAVMLPGVLLTTLFFAGLDPLEVLGATSELVVGYSQTLITQGVIDSLSKYPLGLGTGMSTGPARYALEEGAELPLVETFFAKSVVEFGAPGLVIVVLLLITILIAAWTAKKQLIHPFFRAYGSATLAYCILIAVNSAKGSILDIDPANVLFWLFLGILLKLPFLEAEILRRIGRDRAARAGRQPAPPQGAPPQGGPRGLRPQPAR